MVKTYKEFKKFLTEGLIMTHNIDNTISILDMNLSKLVNNYNISKLKNYVFDIEIYLEISEKILDILFTIVNNCGYFPSYIWLKNINNSINYKYNYDKLINDINSKNITFIKIRFEAKYDELVETKNEYFYHVCKKQNLKKILNIGIIPKSKSKVTTHPERIYLIKNIKDAKDLIKKMEFTDNVNNQNNTEYIILKVKIDNIKLYNDPNYDKIGVYTYDNINRNNIELF